MSGMNRDKIESSSISKGGFGWLKEDLSHALKAMKNKDETNGKDSIRRMLCSLLSNPGVGFVRPTRKRKRSHTNSEENNSLLPHVIELYYKRDTNDDTKDNGSFFDHTKGMNELLDDVNKILNAKQKFSPKFCNRYQQDSIFDGVLHNNNKNFASDKEIDCSNDAQCNRNHLNLAEELLFSDDADNGLYCESDRKIILHFLELETFIKLSYGSQLYDCYISLFNISKDDEKGSKKYISFLKKLTKLAHLDVKIMEIFMMMLLEPLRRKTIVPLDENKYMYWLKLMMRQPNGIQPENDGGSYDVLRDAVVNCISSSGVNSEGVCIFDISMPIIMTLCRLSFPVAKASLETMIEGSVQALASMTSNVIEKLSNINNVHKTVASGKIINVRNDDTYASIDFDSCITNMKRLVETDSRMKSLFSIVLSSNMEAQEFGDVENHVKDERRRSLIKIKFAVLQS